MVITHAHTILRATPQRTEDIRLNAPIPTMPPVMVCVVLTGIPIKEDRKIENAAPDSAQKPSTGLRRVTFWPMVLTIRQPPDIVPKAMAAWQSRMMLIGTKKVSPEA